MRPIASAVIRGTMTSPAAAAAATLAILQPINLEAATGSSAATASILPSILSFVSDHNWAIFAIGLAATPIVALLQGTYFLMRYRLQFGSEVPVPVLPAHGVVLVVDRDDSKGGGGESSRNVDITYREGDDVDLDKTKMRMWGTISPSIVLSRLPSSYPNGKRTPLRLLVIGDSLAAGVGVLSPSSPVPLLPEIVARSLSRALGGTPIFWTCVAEPGASSGWIVRELASRSFLQDDQDGSCEGGMKVDGCKSNEFAHENTSGSVQRLPSASSSPMQKALALSAGGDTIISNIDEADSELAEWCRKLQVHSKRLRTDIMGEYDVAIVMTGLNDLKGALLPFLLTGDEIEFRRQAHARGGDYTAELKRVVDALSDKMKQGLTDYVQNVRERVGSMTSFRKETTSASANTADEMQQSESSRHPLLPTDELSSTQCGAAAECAEDKKAQSFDSDRSGKQYPLVVLTALPSNLPVLQWPPFIWLLKPLIRWTDRIKRKLARRFPHAMLFVEAPKRSAMKKYELKRGTFWLEHEKEDIFLSLRLAPEGECRRIEDAMKSYHEKHITCRGRKRIHRREFAPSCEEDVFGNFFYGKDNIIFPANVHPRAPGASLLSADGIHPNNMGYDCWGRMIADEILKKWR